MVSRPRGGTTGARPRSPDGTPQPPRPGPRTATPLVVSIAPLFVRLKVSSGGVDDPGKGREAVQVRPSRQHTEERLGSIKPLLPHVLQADDGRVTPVVEDRRRLPVVVVGLEHKVRPRLDLVSQQPQVERLGGVGSTRHHSPLTRLHSAHDDVRGADGLVRLGTRQTLLVRRRGLEDLTHREGKPLPRVQSQQPTDHVPVQVEVEARVDADPKHSLLHPGVHADVPRVLRRGEENLAPLDPACVEQGGPQGFREVPLPRDPTPRRAPTRSTLRTAQSQGSARARSGPSRPAPQCWCKLPQARTPSGTPRRTQRPCR
eukprot:Sspe_Gene.3907::Locus_1303_Transcript_1_1_Confidence_1.000_Length_1550::g.3907::m.3907